MCDDHEVSTLAAAQMSLPYALAARLAHGLGRLQAHDDAQRSDPRIVHWMSRIRLEVDPQLSEDGEPVVSLRTVDGRQASLCVEVLLGAPGNPLSAAELEHKFFSLAGRVMSQERAAGLLGQLKRLDEMEIGSFTGSVAGLIKR
jgi:2-methylcitrate dehydratase PrpD